MRILATGDWHGDHVTAGYERFDEVQRAVDRTVDYAIAAANDIDLYLFLGDLCDPDTTDPLVHRAIAASVATANRLRDGGVASVWLTGNHDIIEDGHGSHTLMALKAAGHYVIDHPGSFLLDAIVGGEASGLLLVALPYTSLTKKYDPAEVVRRIRQAREHGALEESRHVIVAGHCTRIAAFEDGSETLDMARGRDLSFPVEEALALKPGATTLLNGHYHQRHLGPVYTPGSLIRCTHGEEDFTPGFLVLEI